MGLIPSPGTKIPHAVLCGKKKKKKILSARKCSSHFPGLGPNHCPAQALHKQRASGGVPLVFVTAEKWNEAKRLKTMKRLHLN